MSPIPRAGCALERMSVVATPSVNEARADRWIPTQGRQAITSTDCHRRRANVLRRALQELTLQRDRLRSRPLNPAAKGKLVPARRVNAFHISLGALRSTRLALLASTFSFLLVSAVSPGAAPTQGEGASPPRRVVSMNLCTDQLAMMIAAPGQLYSVSSLARDPAMSLMANQARAFRPNHGLAEEVFSMQPDLILVGSMTTRATVAMLKRLGFPVVELPFETSFDDMRANIRLMGEVLHQTDRANRLIEQFDADLNRLQQVQAPRRTAVLLHPHSYTSGTGTLANEILNAARYDNVAERLGLSSVSKLPLEQLVLAAPDLVVTDSAWEEAPALAQKTFSHPALLALEATSAKAVSATNRWICATPQLIDLIADLSKAGRVGNKSSMSSAGSGTRQ